jgi:uncharacterized protein YkvS
MIRFPKVGEVIEFANGEKGIVLGINPKDNQVAIQVGDDEVLIVTIQGVWEVPSDPRDYH